jgi:hypothetical protein
VPLATALAGGRTVRNVAWLSQDLLVLIASGSTGNGTTGAISDTIASMRVRWPSSPDLRTPLAGPTVVSTHELQSQHSFLSLTAAAAGEALVQTVAGRVYRLVAGDGAGIEGLNGSGELEAFPEGCEQLLAEVRAYAKTLPTVYPLLHKQ